MKKTLLSFLMVGTAGLFTANAQITINDYNVVGVGNFVEQAKDTIPGSTTIGPNGANQTWNFSSINQDVLDTISFKNPALLTGNSNFPLSNMGMEDTGQDSSWTFLTKNTTGLYVDGFVQIQQGQQNVIPAAATIITFPSTMGTTFGGTWNGTLFGIDVSGAPLGLDSLKTTRQATVASNVDAWGNVTTPFGTFASIRQVVNEQDIDTTWEKSTLTGNWSMISPTTIAALAGFGVNIQAVAYDTVWTARWWTDNAAAFFPVVEMDYEANGTVNEITWQKASPALGLNEVTVNSAVKLYPNPANKAITIESFIADNNSISILDVTGKLVKQLKFTNSKISISITDLDNGIYFYNIYDANGNVLHSNKFVVAK